MKKLALMFMLASSVAAQAAEHVIGISVDGLGSTYLQEMVNAGMLPHFKRLQDEGAGTMNARTDYFMTITLPNHTSMLTGRPVEGADGHGWMENKDPAPGRTLEHNKGSYVASVFDVAHDHGLRTGLWTAKTKFSLFDTSYDGDNGATDATGEDHGSDKLDVYVCEPASGKLTDDFIAAMKTRPCRFAFVHFGAPDAAGHAHGWGSPEYRAAVRDVDVCLGRIMALAADDERLRNKTVVILTSDHGGTAKGHSNAALPINYTIPFYAWGAGVAQADLYDLNRGTRASPGVDRPDYEAKGQPVRNGDLGNLALSELGLGPIPGSRVNAKQDLRIRAAGP